MGPLTGCLRLSPRFQGRRRNCMKRLGVIGCGTWGANHARTLAEIGALKAVADRSSEAAETLAARLGCSALSVDALLDDPEIAGVVIALAPSAHPQVARKAMARGLPFLVEKPQALTAAEARALADEAKSTATPAMTGHVLTFHPAFEGLVHLLREGAIGSLRHIQTQRWGFGRFLPQTDVAFDLFPHDLSMVRALTGAPPDTAQMHAKAHLSDGFDTAELSLSFPGQVTAQCSTSRLSPLRERRILVTGTKGALVFDDMRDWPQKLALTPFDGPAEQPRMGETRFIDTPRTPPLEAELRHFLSCIETGAPMRADLGIGAEIITLIETLSHQTTPRP